MKLDKNITIHESMLKDFVEYINKGWEKNYTVEDVVGVEWEGPSCLFTSTKRTLPQTLTLLDLT